MNIIINSKSGIPIYEQISQQIKMLIIDGNLVEGDSLPSIRSLASDLKISVITTKRAYEELEKESMIYSSPGKGFFVDNPDKAYLEEKRTLGIEEEMKNILDKCIGAGLSKIEVKQMVDILWSEGE